MQQYIVEIEQAAREDIERLHAFLLEAAPEYADQAMERIYKSLKTLEIIPHSCRKAGFQNGVQLRELIIDQGSSGYMALFEIRPEGIVSVLAIKHQRESDYH
jgi:plasmid stabilization system protein ParE